jgi:hypothetical protein
VSRLRRRLDLLELQLHLEGRLRAVDNDGSEDIEARIARCRAEAALTPRDLIVIRQRYCDRASGRAQDPAWRMSPLSA